MIISVNKMIRQYDVIIHSVLLSPLGVQLKYNQQKCSVIELKLTFRCEHCISESPRVVDIRGTRAYIRSSLEEFRCPRCGAVMCEV